MELFLGILKFAVLTVMLIALWQSWRIIRKGRDEETLSDSDVKALTARLTVVQICLAVEAAVIVLQLVLPLIFK